MHIYIYRIIGICICIDIKLHPKHITMRWMILFERLEGFCSLPWKSRWLRRSDGSEAAPVPPLKRVTGNGRATCLVFPGTLTQNIFRMGCKVLWSLTFDTPRMRLPVECRHFKQKIWP